jgi:ribonuclease P protein subunit RPR2
MERIEILFDKAREDLKTRPDRSRRYVQLAFRISMRYNIRLPKTIKRRFCKKCYMYLVPGVSSRLRYGKGILRVSCLNCGHMVRYPMSKKANK